jgi:hypothetical protein
MGGKTVTIHATARHKDLPETVQLQLVAPTGGASVGTRDQMTVTITPSPAFGGNGGGGLFAGLESLLLGLLALGGRRRGVAGPNPPGRTVGTGH